MKNVLIIGLIMLLTGCDLFIKHENLPTVVTEQSTEYVVPEVNIDSYLLQDCSPLITLDKSSVTFNDVVLNTKDNSLLYAECRDKHSALVKILKQSLNLKE